MSVFIGPVEDLIEYELKYFGTAVSEMYTENVLRKSKFSFWLSVPILRIMRALCEAHSSSSVAPDSHTACRMLF